MCTLAREASLCPPSKLRICNCHRWGCRTAPARLAHANDTYLTHTRTRAIVQRGTYPTSSPYASFKRGVARCALLRVLRRSPSLDAPLPMVGSQPGPAARAHTRGQTVRLCLLSPTYHGVSLETSGLRRRRLILAIWSARGTRPSGKSRRIVGVPVVLCSAPLVSLADRNCSSATRRHGPSHSGRGVRGHAKRHACRY
ncbi:hypothetical protein BV20DRAFT_146304 [Pilatotrama ljubarskyi]|nr:hypothetical protein BV20DRAFT_146304 [Pilatotrama ljubarskyi]